MKNQKKQWLRSMIVGALALVAASEAVADTSTETILLMRHGEKPTGGLGQINCQGLNRALALPGVLLNTYGTPNYIFAPNPSIQINDSGTSYYYIRPFATIEPTAVQVGLPVNMAYGFNDADGIENELISGNYANALVFVAWEHKYIVKIAQGIINKLGGDASVVPAWPGSDFDSIYELIITNNNGSQSVQFVHQYENLNGQSTTCPQ